MRNIQIRVHIPRVGNRILKLWRKRRDKRRDQPVQAFERRCVPRVNVAPLRALEFRLEPQVENLDLGQ